MEDAVEKQDGALENTEKEATHTDWEAKAKETEAEVAKWKRIAERNAKKAERSDDSPSENITEKKTDSSELDYGQKALLRAMGIKGPDELQLTKDYMKRTGLDIDALESDDIFQARLDKLRTTKANEIAAEGKSGRGNTNTDQVAKILSTLGPNDPIPSNLPREIREKLVDARRTSSSNNKMFYNE